MEDYDKFIKVNKVKSPKVQRNTILKDYKKELKEQPTKQKKIKILSKRKSKKKNNDFIPTELSIKKQVKKVEKIVKPVVDKVGPVLDDVVDKVKPTVEDIIDKSVSNITKKRKRSKRKSDRYKTKTISVKLNKNKEKDIDKLLKKLNNMKLEEIQKNLKSKGIHSKNKDKDKLLKYMYLLTCVDDNINIIKGQLSSVEGSGADSDWFSDSVASTNSSSSGTFRFFVTLNTYRGWSIIIVDP